MERLTVNNIGSIMDLRHERMFPGDDSWWELAQATCLDPRWLENGAAFFELEAWMLIADELGLEIYAHDAIEDDPMADEALLCNDALTAALIVHSLPPERRQAALAALRSLETP